MAVPNGNRLGATLARLFSHFFAWLAVCFRKPAVRAGIGIAILLVAFVAYTLWDNLLAGGARHQLRVVEDHYKHGAIAWARTAGSPIGSGKCCPACSRRTAGAWRLGFARADL